MASLSETLVNDDHKDYDRQDHCSIDGDCDDDNVDDIKNWSDQSYGGQWEEGGKEAEGKEQIQLWGGHGTSEVLA